MNKNDYAPIAPMGWNSYDYYDTTVNEEQVRANAAYLAEHLKDAGYEYVVVDIEWYAKEGRLTEKILISIFHTLNWQLTNIHAYSQIRSVSHHQQMVRALRHLQIMYIALA